MKKFRQFFKSLFARHIVGPAPVAFRSQVQEYVTDLEMIRFSIWEYLRAAKEHERFLLKYVADYSAIMEEVRMEGWAVELHAAPDGSLVYLISADQLTTFA